MNMAKAVVLGLLLVGVFVLMLSVSPGIPKIDASSTSAIRDSLSKIRSSLGDKSKMFDEDCSYLIYPGQGGRRKVPDAVNLYKKLHNWTAKRVQHEADLLRRADIAQGIPGGNADQLPEPVKQPPPRKIDVPKPTIGHVKPPDPNLVPDLTWDARPGDEALLFNPKGELIFVFATEAALGLYQQARQAKDQDGIDDLLSRGKAFQAENGTRVEVLQRRDDPVPALKVALKNGAYFSQTLWVSIIDVAKLVHPSDHADQQPEPPPGPAQGPAQPPETPAAKLESLAQTRLEAGLRQEQDRHPGPARQIYEGIKRDYPDTKAAAKAQAQLDILDGSKNKNKKKMMK
jgi:hypothetical protein